MAIFADIKRRIEMKKLLSVCVLGCWMCQIWAQGLSRLESDLLRDKIVGEWKTQVHDELAKAQEEFTIRKDTLELKFHAQVFGERPSDGRSLWISLHGGGGTTTEVNNQQWDNQKRLYRPKEGVYVAPRAPWDAWDMWFQAPIDGMYQDLIRLMVANYDVNPNKVYLLGYSAGGDGVWRLAPRLADYWAATSMMAGHPGDVRLENLLNTPFMIWMGSKDAAYDRNKLAAVRGAQMDSLQQAHPDGYIHETHIIQGKGHWMDRMDTVAISWMAKYTRQPYPKHVIWQQEEVGKQQFYWLEVPFIERGRLLDVSIKGNTITIHHTDYRNIRLWLNDELVDLDKKIKVKKDGKTLFKGKLERNERNLRQSIQERQDPAYCFPAQVEISTCGCKD